MLVIPAVGNASIPDAVDETVQAGTLPAFLKCI
ncbi:hypothetical protein V22_41170 [Calycomorphotria hydatis]|uniref:Uncharacterized protein n=1 Tax=Calycomorphotria hydatis TaxID=2528027 RepID=A0A517TEQ2_9PLAN|nr:hypothetical protein V22_41170 [Calycomorphotria hydatis]